jgi:DNA polymerase elongation subunit (family B)
MKKKGGNLEYLTVEDETDFKELVEYLKNKTYDLNGNTIKTDDYVITLEDEYVKKLDNPYSNKIIYGKDETENIISAEVKDDLLWLFKNDGTVETRPLRLWITCAKRPSLKWDKLEGNQTYKYIRRFSTVEEWKDIKSKMYKKRYDFFTVNNLVENQLIENGITLFKGLKVDNVSRLGFDIEADGLVTTKNSVVYTIANTFRSESGEEKIVFRVDEYDNDPAKMIDAWCDWVRKKDPTVLVAHNGFGYDMKYLNHVAKLYGTSLYLGKDASEVEFSKYEKNYRYDGNSSWSYTDCKIFGRHIVDTAFLAVKYDVGRNFPSWGLKPIIEHLGLVKEGRQFYDASKIRQNWSDLVEREKIVEYCSDDGDDCLNLYELMVPSFFYLCQSIPKPFQLMLQGASGSWLNTILMRAYLQDGRSVAKKSEKVEGEKVSGGISFGRPDVHKNVFKIDIKSMYPSIMRHWKVSDPDKDPDNYFFKLADTFTKERFRNKALYKETGNKFYDDMQASQKIFINSLYGMMGASLNYNSYKNADFVTGMGRQIIRKTIIWATGHDIEYWWGDYDKDKDAKYDKVLDIDLSNGYDFTIVNADTDSISFRKTDGGIFTDEEMEALIDDINSRLPKLIEYEDDGYFDKVVVVKAKNYVLKENGKDKIKYKGSSLTDSKKEPALLEFLREVIEQGMIYETVNIEDIYHKYLKEAINIQDINRWAVKKSVTEKLFESDRANETKVVDAIGDKPVQVGDKIYVFNDIDGLTQKVTKGEPVFLKNGEPKMVDNCILRLVEDFDGKYDKYHYVERVYKTLKILEKVVEIKKFTKYHLKSNRKLLEDL